MTRISWGTPGRRLYEAGVDRGVLYVNGLSGVPWDGLLGVQESPSGGEAKPYYLDGNKYLNRAASEEFAGTIEAFTSPKEFGLCDGTASIANGLFIGEQPRQPFNFVYRTKLGNDIDGLSLGYKLNIVYNALASPASKNHASINDSAEANKLSWSITTTPVFSMGHKASAHFTIDSTKAPAEMISIVENLIYGTMIYEPRLPLLDELKALFTGFRPREVILLGDGRYTAEGYMVVDVSPGVFTLEDDYVLDLGNGKFTID